MVPYFIVYYRSMAKRLPTGKIREFQKEYFKTVSTMAIAGFSLVAALAWNELIKTIIDRYIAPGSSVISHIVYAVVVTTIVVAVTMWLGSIAKRFDENSNH